MNANLFFLYILIFYSDENFYQNHSIPSKMPIKLFIRVKERIKPDQCSHKITLTSIEITLIKESEHGILWNRLEPNEYSESRPTILSPPSSTFSLPITNTNSIMNNINRGKN